LTDKLYLHYLFKNYFRPDENLKFLDVGAGVNDNFKSYFNSTNTCLANLDVSFFSLQQLRKRIGSQEVPIRCRTCFIQGSVLDLPFQENFFDLVVCCQCLHYFSGADRNKALNEVIRVCKRGGSIIIAVKNRYSIQSVFTYVSPRNPLPFHPFTYKEIMRKTASLAGVQIFGNIKIPLLKDCHPINVFLNRHLNKTKFGLLSGMDLVLFAQKIT